MVEPNSGAVYNVADSNPAPRDEVLSYAAELMGLDAALDPGRTGSARAARAKDESKRVNNRRLLHELAYELRYPSYEAGLEAIHGGSDISFCLQDITKTWRGEEYPSNDSSE